TLLENVILPMELNNLYSKKERKERAMQLLATVEMAEQAHKLPSAVSGGQQQRVAIARALANDPPLLVADEPTGNLDSKTAAKIFALFEELVASGKTILMVTHDSALARRVNRTILISDGEIVNEYLVRALSTLTQDQLVEVTRRVKPQHFPAGATIVRQGEEGDKFYILLEGEADVFIAQPGGMELQVNRLKKGQYFGEMALMGGGIRTATVKASEDAPVSAVALDANAFNNLVNDSRSLRDELSELIEKRNIYNQVQAFSSLDQSTLAEILHDHKAVSYPEGFEIIKQGDVGETFYLLADGEVDVAVHDEDGVETNVNRLKKGACFGEMALMGEGRRTATVRVAQGKSASVVELTAAEFESLARSSERFKSEMLAVAGKRKQQLGKRGPRKVQK
ncbi:MAG: cyclic nucleotide-binding domain-containing protein, partial [Chloroflexota bacterium]